MCCGCKCFGSVESSTDGPEHSDKMQTLLLDASEGSFYDVAWWWRTDFGAAVSAEFKVTSHFGVPCKVFFSHDEGSQPILQNEILYIFMFKKIALTLFC